MTRDEYVIGVDEGTTDTRVIVFNSEGYEVGEGRGAYELLTPKPGWVEQKAEWWWDALKGACREAVRKSGVDPKKIRAMGITHQRCTIVPVDENVKPLRNAMVWNDSRCVEQVKWVWNNIGAKRVYERTGYPPAVPWALYKAMWVRDNEPQVYNKTHLWLLVFDYLVYKLTGNLLTTSGSATMTGCLDIANPSHWATDIIEACGVRSEVWPRICPPAMEVGTVTAKAAEETGLPEGLPVISAAGDQPCGTLGVGVVKPGLIGVNGGTSCTFETVTPELHVDPNMNFFIEYSPIGAWAPEGAIKGGGAAMMHWFKDNFGYQEVCESKETGVRVWSIIDKKAAEAPAGCLGLITIPYWGGVLQPYWDPRARGIILGFGLAHKRSHFIRALMEGLAYEVRRNIELMETSNGYEIEELRMYGGCSRSDIWNQIFADICAKPLCVVQTPETTTLGAAICAAKAGGLYKSVEEAAENMVHVKKRYEPIQKNLKIYERLYKDVYVNTYDRVKDLAQQISDITDYYP